MDFGARYFSGILPAMFLVLSLGCADASRQRVEEAQFELDKGNFGTAETKAREALREDPNSVEARLVLGSALLGKATLGDGGTLLTPIAKLEESKSKSQSDFSTFGRIAPDNVNSLGDLEEATDTFNSVKGKVTEDLKQALFLKLYVARMFEIGGAVTRIGANSATKTCKPLNSSQLDRFRDNLNEAPNDGKKAGLASNFELNGRISDISTELTKTIDDSGGDEAQGAADFFNAAFDFDTPCP